MSGGNLSFKEEQVHEVVKKVILPIWNTYSFFTTYANIDKFKPETNTHIYYVRHGETDNNLHDIMNGGDDDLDLNKRGIEQAHEAGVILPIDVKFDIIITSPMKRAKHTAEVLKSYMDYDVETVEVEGFREQLFGEYK